MDPREKISSDQFLALTFVALLSPIVRRIPRSLIMLSGGASWLSVLFALPVCMAVFLLVRRCLCSGRGLGELLTLSLGKYPGRALLVLTSLWLSFYCGFLLHSAAHRLVSTIYTRSSPAPFIIISAALCLAAAAGPFRALGRMAMLFRPILLAVLALVFIFAFGDWEIRGVLPLTPRDLMPVSESAVSIINTFSLIVYMCFLAGQTRSGARRGRFALWCVLLLLITELMCLSCLGIFGTELSLKLNYPFFMLVRDISIFDSLARIEALVIVLWTLADFTLISLMLRIAADASLAGLFPPASFPDKKGKLVCALLATAAAVAALVIPGDILSLGLLSEKLVPAVNFCFIFLVYPLSLLIGRLRRKI